MDEIITSYGSKGVSLEDIAHLLVPGRGRDASGRQLTNSAALRVREAAKVFKALGLGTQGGVIVVCGYKSPGDRSGKTDEFRKGYIGIPEADLMAQLLRSEGIPESAIRVEHDSIDTVTNLAFAESNRLFPDDRPVAIVAQKGHLERILKFIAPKLLKRSFMGIIVPDCSRKDNDSIFAAYFSRIILLGITPASKNCASKVYKRAGKLWRLANIVRLGRPYKQR